MFRSIIDHRQLQVVHDEWSMIDRNMFAQICCWFFKNSSLSAFIPTKLIGISLPDFRLHACPPSHARRVSYTCSLNFSPELETSRILILYKFYTWSKDCKKKLFHFLFNGWSVDFVFPKLFCVRPVECWYVINWSIFLFVSFTYIRFQKDA